MNVGTNNESAFNAGVEYLKTLTTYEREIAQSFWRDDYLAVNNGLEVLYMELSEWFDKEETKKHNTLRLEQAFAHKTYLDLTSKGKFNIPSNIIEAYKIRFMELKKVIHAHGLRMAKKEDMGEEPEEW